MHRAAAISLVLMAVACGPHPRVLAARRISPGTELDGGCQALPEQLPSGTRDISTGTTYLAHFDLDRVGTEPFITSDVDLTYTSFPVLTFSPEKLPVRLSITQAEPWATFELIGPKAGVTLQQKAPPGTKDGDFLLNVTFTLSGILGGGTWETDPVKYSISIINSGFDPSMCPAGTAPALSGPCGQVGGQDGAPFCCGGTIPCP